MSTFLNIDVPQGCLARARTGERRAQHELYELLARPVYTLLYRLVQRPAIAEELLHDVFIEVLGHLADWRGSGSFSGWVRSIAVHQALNHLRSPRLAAPLADSPAMEVVPLPGAGHGPPGPEEAASFADLERALAELAPLARTVVWLHDVEGYTHAEIGRLHGQTASFSKSQLMRAHAALRGLLATANGADRCTLASTN